MGPRRQHHWQGPLLVFLGFCALYFWWASEQEHASASVLRKELAEIKAESQRQQRLLRDELQVHEEKQAIAIQRQLTTMSKEQILKKLEGNPMQAHLSETEKKLRHALQVDTNSGYIRATQSGLCLEDRQQKTVITYYCSAEARYLWSYVQGKITSPSDMCITASAIKADAEVILRPCNDNADLQTWDIQAEDRFYWNVSSQIVLKSSQSSKSTQPLCITAHRGPKELDGSTLQLQPCERSCHQFWHVNAYSVPFQQVATSKSSPTVQQQQRAAGTSLSATDESHRHKLFCMVMVTPSDLYTSGKAIMDTWGSRCDTLVFVNSESHPSFPTWKIDLPGPESRELMWFKSRHAWLRAYNTQLKSHHWFLRAERDTYVLVDNLREKLADQDPEAPISMGRLFHGRYQGENMTYFSSGAGMVLSRGALSAIGQAAMHNSSHIFVPDIGSQSDDISMGVAMLRTGIPAQLTVDEHGGQYFSALGVAVERTVKRSTSQGYWYWEVTPETKDGPACCARRWIGSHYAKPSDMYAFDDLHALGCEGV
ncbi:uncharacterized protein MONBRDRAFT_28361 [Monosiga brevicollis MX1]|uniref:N-acetylgalactosaminide beta-1,3-galactosyltransferase n=1 Tax=Monosiga brevicollis TaxID=81824 RepID=A9V7Y4_MONBE|nr:uncharacterized protein MONBRDRAFT_28361 [Monosiga brevicollis MX1]EDQ86385.1 predicted protein [Monosiga brevicollis MX1]|eukprot:XP_001748775.1 hypothetical protein [Monosiga brevicollis MX1]